MKHDNYSEWVEMTIVRHDDKFYTLEYTAPSDERYELYGTKDEILAELGEHMELMYQKSTPPEVDKAWLELDDCIDTIARNEIKAKHNK